MNCFFWWGGGVEDGSHGRDRSYAAIKQQRQHTVLTSSPIITVEHQDVLFSIKSESPCQCVKDLTYCSFICIYWHLTAKDATLMQCSLFTLLMFSCLFCNHLSYFTISLISTGAYYECQAVRSTELCSNSKVTVTKRKRGAFTVL